MCEDRWERLCNFRFHYRAQQPIITSFLVVLGYVDIFPHVPTVSVGNLSYYCIIITYSICNFCCQNEQQYGVDRIGFEVLSSGYEDLSSGI
jgi:hypothetical protein